MINNKDKGFVLLWRSMNDNKVLNDGNTPFDKYHAWCDLICMANHRDNTILEYGNPVIIRRGQRKTSILKLATRWRWDRKTVSRFLSVLELNNMISTERTRKGTTITIVNYDTYNDLRPTDGATNGTTVGTTVGTQTINDKNNDIENEKQKARRFPLYDNRGVLIEE